MILTLLKSNLHLLTSRHGRSDLFAIEKKAQCALYIGTEYVYAGGG